MASKTIHDARLPDTPSYAYIRETWTADAAEKILSRVWSAWLNYRRKCLDSIDVTQATLELERCITQDLELEIRLLMDGLEPFTVQHERIETASRRSTRGRSPQYDIAFISTVDPRVMWPLEAKVLRTDRSIRQYVREVKENFLSCRYAPFSFEAGMLGYLIAGSSEIAFENIAKVLTCALEVDERFVPNPHRISQHVRSDAQCPYNPSDFCCHHLIFVLSS